MPQPYLPPLPTMPRPLPARNAAAPAGTPYDDLQLGDGDMVLDALSLRAWSGADLPGAPGVKLISALNSGLDASDAYDAVSTASTVIGVLAPTLSNTAVGAGLNAALLTTGVNPLRARDQALTDSIAQFKQATGNRVQAALGVGVATAQLSLAYRAVVNAGLAVGRYLLHQLAHVPGFADDAWSLQELAKAVSETPAGRVFGVVNKWLPFINLAWILMAIKTAFDVVHTPGSSRTSRTLALINIGTSVGVVLAGISASCPTFFLAVLGGLFVELALATARQVDAKAGDTDRRMGWALTHPVQGARAGARWLALVAKAIKQQKTNRAQQAIKRFTPDKQAPFQPNQVLVGSRGAAPVGRGAGVAASRTASASERPPGQSTT